MTEAGRKGQEAEVEEEEGQRERDMNHEGSSNRDNSQRSTARESACLVRAEPNPPQSRESKGSNFAAWRSHSP